MTLQQAIMLAVQVSILMTVFAFGLRTTIGDVLYVVQRPSLLARSLVAMFAIMPLIAIAMARAFDLNPSIKIVLVALAISPIPPLLPRKEGKVGGNASYALGLMVVVALMSIVTVPVSVNLLGWYLMRPLEMSSGAIAAMVLKVAILPLAAGLLVHAMWPALAARIVKPVALIATVLLTIGVLGLLAGTLAAALRLIGDGRVFAMTFFIVAGLAAGHWLGGPDPSHRLVLALSTASRHPAIALAVAKANFPDEPQLGATIVLYLLLNAIIGIPYNMLLKRKLAGRPPGD